MNKYWWQEAVIYQGEEIGRTNIKFSESSDFDDIGKNSVTKLQADGNLTDNEILELANYRSLDNARLQCTGIIKDMQVFLKLSPG